MFIPWLESSAQSALRCAYTYVVLHGDAARPHVAPEACVGLWITEDGTRAMSISVAPEGGLRVSVWRRSDLAPHLVDRPAKWHAPVPSAASNPNAKERIGYLQVELGEPGLGTTYDLMVACRNADPAACGCFQWGAVPEGAARESVRMFPQGGASYFEAVLGYYDDFVEDLRSCDEWMQPLSTWRPTDADA